MTGRKASMFRGERARWSAFASGWERWEPVLMYGLGALDPILFRALELEPGLRVVDFGCGSGEPTLAIAQIGRASCRERVYVLV